MSKVTVNQLEKTLKSLTRNDRFSRCKNFESLLDVLMTECESFRAPFYVHDVSVIEERVMLYNHKLYNAKSNLCELLASRYKQVLLMVDAVLPAKEAIHFVTMTDEPGAVREWTGLLSRFDLMLRQVDYSDSKKDYILVAPITSFLKPNA